MSPRAGLSERLKLNDAFRHEGTATVTFVLPLGAKPEDGERSSTLIVPTSARLTSFQASHLSFTQVRRGST